MLPVTCVDRFLARFLDNGSVRWPLVRHCTASNKRWRMERERESLCALSFSKPPAVGLRTAGRRTWVVVGLPAREPPIGRGKWTVEGKGKAEIFLPPWGRFALSPNGSCIKNACGYCGFGVWGLWGKQSQFARMCHFLDDSAHDFRLSQHHTNTRGKKSCRQFHRHTGTQDH